jgi:hypothetical protein
VTVEGVAHTPPRPTPLTPYTDLSSDNPMIRYEVRYQVPYNACEWRSQWFRTLDEAERMVAFYLSCGSPAHLAP